MPAAARPPRRRDRSGGSPTWARRSWPSRRCARWWTTASTSRSSCRSPTGDAAGGATCVPSPVKAAALELGLPVTDRVDDVLDADVPLGVVVAFGRLIKPHVLEAVPMVNLHFSLLPRWRGAAPVERAILAGDERTGVDLMAVEEGLDTGGTYRRTEVPIGPDDTLEELRGRLVEEGTRLLVSALAGGHRRAHAPGRRADLRRQAHRRGSAPRLERARRRRPPPGAPRRRLDHPRGQAPQGLADARAARRGRPPRRAPPTARWSSSRCSPRARAAWTPRRGRTAPIGTPATPSARDATARHARPRRPRPHRARRRLRQPAAPRAAPALVARDRATGTSPPSSSTARRA